MEVIYEIGVMKLLLAQAFVAQAGKTQASEEEAGGDASGESESLRSRVRSCTLPPPEFFANFMLPQELSDASKFA